MSTVERTRTSTERVLNALTLRWSTTALRAGEQCRCGGWNRTNVSGLMRPACELTRSPHILSSKFFRRGVADRVRTCATWSLKPMTLPVGLRRRSSCRGNAGTRTQLSKRRSLYRRPRCLNRQHSRGGDRRDSHPLPRGSLPRVSTASTSTTVRLEGIAPSPLAYQASARAVVLQAGRSRSRARQKIRRPMARFDLAAVTPRRPSSPKRIGRSRLPAN